MRTSGTHGVAEDGWEGQVRAPDGRTGGRCGSRWQACALHCAQHLMVGGGGNSQVLAGRRRKRGGGGRAQLQEQSLGREVPDGVTI